MAGWLSSTQVAALPEQTRLPMFAASDIVAGAPVRIASNGDWQVQMCQTSADKPIGVARDFAIAGNAITVYANPGVVRSNIGGNGAAGSFSRQAYVGVIGTSSMTHPQSGVTVTFGVLGQVTGTPSIAVGASTTAIWAVGQAFEGAAVGDFAAYQIDPRLLSGLVTS